MDKTKDENVICPGCSTCANCDVEKMYKNPDGTQGHFWLGTPGSYEWCDFCDDAKGSELD